MYGEMSETCRKKNPRRADEGRRDQERGSRRRATRMYDGMTVNAALRGLGYPNDVHVHHGFRVTASTRLSGLGVNRNWTERQSTHASETGFG
jgi:hypothetical protein